MFTTNFFFGVAVGLAIGLVPAVKLKYDKVKAKAKEKIDELKK